MGDRSQQGSVPTVSGRILTVPNLLTALRISLVPVFLWLVLVRHDDLAALWTLVVSGATDWVDGVVARRYDQVTRLGQLLDPVADRLTVLSTLTGLVLTGVIPWWLVLALLARDVWGVAEMARLRRHGLRRLPVTFVGKAATFCLLACFPLLLLAHVGGAPALVARPLGWALGLWGLGLYWLSAIMYYVQAQQVVRRAAGEGAA